jgi:DNA gyrase subunit B
MYVGPVDSDGVFTVLRECLDNAVDEARAGRNDLIQVHIDKAQFTVVDHGVGIPVAKHPVMKISTLTHVLTNLQSSGKMKKGAYESAIGTHGVGIKGTNALSATFTCWTYRKDSGGWHSTAFKQGRETQPVKKCRAPKVAGKTVKSGTVIQFSPDPDIFGKHQLDMKRLTVWAEMTAYMNAGLTIQVFHNGKMRQWFSKKGVQEYLAKRMKELEAEPFNKTPLHHTSHTLDLCLNFTNAEGEQIEFFTNTVRNVDRGIHADAMFKALVDAIEPYKGARQHFTPTDLREGLVGVLNYKVTAPQFSSQTKDKLVDIRVKEPCYNECLKVFEAFFKANKTFTKELCARASALRERTADFLKDKKLIKEVNAAKKLIGTKLADVTGKRPPSECELFIVEGESAGGGAKRARDKSF